MTSSGGTRDPKRIRVHGGRAACVVRALAEAQGLAVVDGEGNAADLSVVEVTCVDDLRAERAASSPATPSDPAPPIVALARRRLRDGEAKALIDAGASAVIDAESNILDVAFAFSDLLFGTRMQQRRYSRVHGGTQVRLRTLDLRPEVRASGQLVDVLRPGALVITDAHIPDGAAIEVEIRILGRVVPLRGRVAYASERDQHEGVVVEFALGDNEVAPKLFALCDETTPTLESRRSASSPRGALSSARSA